MQLLVGAPLDELDTHCRGYLPQMKDLKRAENVLYIRPIWQAAMNLMGCSEHPTKMVGEALCMAKDEEEIFRMAQASVFSLRNLEMLKNALHTYFGEYEKGADLAIARGEDSYLRDLPSMPAGMWDLLFTGICLFSMACISNKQKYKKYALRARAKVHSWLQKGNPNVGHHAALLDAEYYVLKKKHDKASKCYEDAIVKASRGGFIHDVALASERYAQFLLSSNVSDHEGALFRIHDAIRSYSEWGAKAKVDDLLETYKDLLEPSAAVL